MIDLEQLNAHSRLFADILFREFPQWLQHARFDPYEDFEKEALLVEIPSLVDGSSNGLFITTSEWEISIGYGESFHTRFGTSGEDERKSFNEEALQFLIDFVDEKVVIATASENGEWLGGWKIDLRESDLDSIEVQAGEKVIVRSWQGTFNQEKS